MEKKQMESLTIFAEDNSDISILYHLLLDEDFFVEQCHVAAENTMGASEYILIMLPMLPDIIKSLENVLTTWLNNNSCELHIRRGDDEITLKANNARTFKKQLDSMLKLGIAWSD